ncbi:MAG: glutaredoxin family protein [Desulfobacterium sp.]|jgi:mycoredoxin|nr:glutaredoxin family protein [Desulfobacterium sp.]
MLKIYSASWCPHCTKTVEYLKKNKIEFKYIEIEKQPDEAVKKVIQVNGGDDWVVPTLEFNGKWRPGKIYNEFELYFDLKEMGVIGQAEKEEPAPGM